MKDFVRRVKALFVPLLVSAGLALAALPAVGQTRLTIAISSLGPETWVPQDLAFNKYIIGTIGDPLIRLVSGNKLEPAIAASWKMSDDGLTYEFVIRNDVFFHDGTKLTAEDVAYNLSPDMTKNFVGSSRVKGGNLISTTAQGNRVIMKLKTPVPMMLDNYIVRYAIWPKAYLERVGTAGFNKEPIGSGPYRLTKHDKGQSVVLQAFDKYYGGKPKIEQITFRIVPEAATRIAMLKTGEADASFNEVGPSTGEAKKAGMRVLPFGQSNQKTLIVNHLLIPGKDSRFKDARVRRALMAAVDRTAIANALYSGLADPGILPVVGQDMPFFDAKFKALAYEPAKAKALLAEAGFPAGFEFDLYAGTENRELSTLLVSFWQQVGLKATLKPMDRSALATAWYQRKIEGDSLILANGLANGIASLVYLDPKAQVAMYAAPETEKLVAVGMEIHDPAAQDAWLKGTLLPELERIYPVPVIIEHAEGVIAIGKRIKAWDKFDFHSLGLQWLVLN